MIHGVHFDLDGTLVDSYAAITDALNRALEELHLPTRTAEEVRGMVGGGVRNVLVQAAGEAYADEGAERFRTHYRDVVLKGTKPLPGALETLAQLRLRGYRVGVATNKPSDFARLIVDHFGMSEHVEVVAGPAEVANPKPAPDMLHLICARLDLEPSRCVYVGDMPIDAETARRAGMAAWLVPTGSASLEDIRAANPERVLDSLLECLEYLPAVRGHVHT